MIWVTASALSFLCVDIARAIAAVLFSGIINFDLIKKIMIILLLNMIVQMHPIKKYDSII